MLVFPVILIVLLLLVPFISNRGERAPSRRPVAVLGVVVVYTLLGILTYEGTASPWSPKMTAWSGDPIPARLVEQSHPMELMGAAMFQNKSCRNCHAIDGIGGRRGPDLTSVATRLTRDQLIDQISNGTPGGGNMPAYGKEMNPDEMATLVAFLMTLRPENRPPAQVPTRTQSRRSENWLHHEPGCTMNPTLDAALRSWPAEPWLLVGLIVAAAIYTRGWLFLHRRAPRRWRAGQLGAFCGGLAAIYVALASPIETFASLLLAVHMVQHVLLMMAVPPLIWLGAPLFPILRGLPQPVRTYWAGPMLRNAWLRRWFTRLTQPSAALLLFTAATWLWHWPAAYELALRSPRWHYLEHACFLGTGLLFWFPVVRPYPSRARWSKWVLLPYLFLADVQNTVLSALLTFSGTLLFRYYAEVPRLGGWSALADQQAAGVIMWVPGSIAFLVPMFCIGVKLLYGERETAAGMRRLTAVQRAKPQACCNTESSAAARLRFRAFDVLRMPLVGRFLKWRHARTALQVPMLLLAALVIADGLHGPQVGAMNLAGVLPWIHWRGLLILLLLVAGNVFCMACPFTLPRSVARRWWPAKHDWPRWLRSKWLAAGLVALFFWAYEAFSLVGQPVVERLDRRGVFHRGVCDRFGVSRGGVLQIPLSDRSVQFRAIARLAA